MNQLPIIQFVDRVLTTQETVQFTEVDPFGHLNASRYAEYIINHRITAADQQLQIATVDLAKLLGVAFVVVRLDVRYLSPTFLGEIVEVASWVEEVRDNGFSLKIVVSGAKNKKVRALAIQELRTVDFKTGMAVSCPATLPTRGSAELLESRPLKQDYISVLKGFQEIK